MSHVDHIKRALSYPYAQEEQSFALHGSQVQKLPAAFNKKNRIPVIASGSNASPQQLLRKFAGLAQDPLYITQAKLTGFVSCYSAHITAYGSIPATLAFWRGSVADCHITWLTQAQLDHMHKTEALGVNYRFSKLERINLDCEIFGELTEAYAYISLHGNLVANDAPILISEIASTTSAPLIRLSQPEIQNKFHKTLAPESSLEEFVMSNITQQERRSDRNKCLRQTAHNFSYPFERVILT